MARIKKRRAKVAGLPPGTLVYTGQHGEVPVHLTIFEYNAEFLSEREVKSAEECFHPTSDNTFLWINIDGLHDVPVITKIGEHFGIHPLALEDILNVNQRPKLDDYDNYLYLTLRMIDFDAANDTLSNELVSFILTPGAVLSFQENVGDVLGTVRERLRNNRGRIRKCGPDYLLYALIDAIVDHYFVALEKIDDRIEDLEEIILKNPDPKVAGEIHGLKRKMIVLRKSVWPLREVLAQLERCESRLVTRETSLFLRDVYDHSIQVIETVEAFRDILSGLLEIYLATVSNRMNEVMKVLTIISTIFIPLTFIVGVYGMNFDNLPELHTEYGYFVCLGAMALIAGVMVRYFRKKKWL